MNEDGFQQRPIPHPISMAETLTLRDQFAMAALSALLSGRANGERTHWAKVAYEIADAMLEARKEKK